MSMYVYPRYETDNKKRKLDYMDKKEEERQMNECEDICIYIHTYRNIQNKRVFLCFSWCTNEKNVI